MRKGTLVRVLRHKLDERDQRKVDTHGTLWIATDEQPHDDQMHACKSLATGAEYLWFSYEVEEG